MGESGFSQQFSRKITRDLEIPGLRKIGTHSRWSRLDARDVVASGCQGVIAKVYRGCSSPTTFTSSKVPLLPSGYPN